MGGHPCWEVGMAEGLVPLAQRHPEILSTKGNSGVTG